MEGRRAKEMIMTAMQFLNVLRQYGADVLILAVGVSLITSLLKKTVLKNCPTKVYVFLPFLLGLLMYTAYRMAVTWSVVPVTEELRFTIESGLGCGSVATIYYVVYEQFFKKGKTKLSLSPVLEGIVPDSVREEAADALLTGCKGLKAEELFAFVERTLARYASPSLSEAEAHACVRALSALLSALKR